MKGTSSSSCRSGTVDTSVLRPPGVVVSAKVGGGGGGGGGGKQQVAAEAKELIKAGTKAGGGGRGSGGGGFGGGGGGFAQQWNQMSGADRIYLGAGVASMAGAAMGEYSELGGALSGAGTGAMIGMTVAGPVGAVVGGVIGAIAGLFGAKKRRRERAKQKAAEEARLKRITGGFPLTFGEGVSSAIVGGVPVTAPADQLAQAIGSEVASQTATGRNITIQVNLDREPLARAVAEAV